MLIVTMKHTINYFFGLWLQETWQKLYNSLADALKTVAGELLKGAAAASSPKIVVCIACVSDMHAHESRTPHKLQQCQCQYLVLVESGLHI